MMRRVAQHLKLMLARGFDRRTPALAERAAAWYDAVPTKASDIYSVKRDDGTHAVVMLAPAFKALAADLEAAFAEVDGATCAAAALRANGTAAWDAAMRNVRTCATARDAANRTDAHCDIRKDPLAIKKAQRIALAAGLTFPWPGDEAAG